MRQTICLLLLWALVLSANGQDRRRDSLLKLLPTAKADTTKALLLINIADTYETNNQDSAVYYLEKSLELSESLGFLKGKYQYYNKSAIVSYTKGDYATSMEQNKEGLKLARQLKDSSLVITTLNNIAIVYAYLGDFESQLKYVLQVKNAAEAVKDSNKLAAIYHGLGNAYYNLKRYRKSVDYTLLSVRVTNEFKKRNDYINRVYATLGQDYEALKMSDSAIYYYEKAIEESIKANDKYAEGTIFGYLSSFYGDNNQFGEMLKAGERSLELAKELQSRQMVANSLYYVAYANFFNGDNVKARQLINKALEISTADSLFDELRADYLVLSYIAARDGDYKTFVWAKKKTDSIQEAILNEQVIKNTTELEKKYETEKKDDQLKLQEISIRQKDSLNYILIGSAAALLIISVLSFRNYKVKQRLQQQRIIELETEKQLTATEAVLRGEEQERTRLAKDLHDGLGGMLSGIKYSFETMKGSLIASPDNVQAFERSMDMLDSSIKEMRRVAHNMMPVALVKFGLDTALRDFCKDINQSGAINVNYQSMGLENTVIEQTTAISIYRIVQELINNTMKHAVAKTAIVQVAKTDGQISITVEDDGKGFDPQLLQNAKGMGWSNIQDRVEFLKGKLDVQSEPGKGTSVLIELKA